MPTVNLDPLFQGNPSECVESFTYNVDGTVATATLTDREGRNWRQTFTYTDGLITNITPWVKV